jgi:uncharacterized protein (DUF1330 family)
VGPEQGWVSAGVFLSAVKFRVYAVMSTGERQGKSKPMKTKYAIAGMVVGFGLGAAALQGLHAQTKPPALVIVEVAVSDPEAYAKEFLPPVTKTVKDTGGKFLAVGGKTASLTGTPPAGRVVVVQWPSMDQLESWWNAPATKDAYATGFKYAKFRIFAVEGPQQ